MQSEFPAYKLCSCNRANRKPQRSSKQKPVAAHTINTVTITACDILAEAITSYLLCR